MNLIPFVPINVLWCVAAKFNLNIKELSIFTGKEEAHETFFIRSMLIIKPGDSIDE